jgi:hypothetical protein
LEEPAVVIVPRVDLSHTWPRCACRLCTALRERRAANGGARSDTERALGISLDQLT